jgi:hypothetical protein
MKLAGFSILGREKPATIDTQGRWGWDHGDDDGQGSLHSDRP